MHSILGIQVTRVALSEYSIYLSSKYTKLKLNVETNLTATLSFGTGSTSISA